MAAESLVQGEAWSDAVDRAEALTDGWIAALRSRDGASGPDLLGGLQRDAEGFEFTRRLLEMVAGTEDAFASAIGFREVAHEAPKSLPARDRFVVRAGGAASIGLPWAVMPVARRWLRERVSGLVLATRLPSEGSASGRLTGLGDALRRSADLGIIPVSQPLGDAIHGPAGAAAEVARLVALAQHAVVGHLVVDPARIAPGGTDWSADDDVARAAEALGPILAAAAEHGTTVHIEPGSVRWARLVPDLLARALADPALDRARVGARLMAELPESREMYDRLSRWAQRRVADGGAPAEVVIGIGGVAGHERVASILSGLAVPVLEDRGAVAAQLLRLVELALHPGRAAVLRPVIASEDAFVLGGVAALADRLGSAALCSVQLRSGVVPGLAEILAGAGGAGGAGVEVRLVVPVISPREFGGAVDMLVGFAAEAADPESSVSRLERVLAPEPEGAEARAAGHAEFREAAIAAAECHPASHRTQLRAREWDPTERDSALFYRPPEDPVAFDTGGLTAAVLGLGRGSGGGFALEAVVPPKPIPVVSASGFVNEPPTDATVAANREWARDLLRRSAAQAEGDDAANATVALSQADLDPAVAALQARESGERWGEVAPQLRSSRLRRAALATAAARDRLLQVIAADTGAPIAELDAEVDDIVDAARYAGLLAERLAVVRGATFVSGGLVLVAAEAGRPLSEQAEAVLGALAAGNGVLWSVPQRLAGSAAALVEEWEIGGLPRGAVHLEAVAVPGTLPRLAARPDTDRAIVLGRRATAHELARRRPDLQIEGGFTVLGSTVVTPSADLDAAIRDAVASAFRGAGAHPRSAQRLILVGSVARSKRFREGLADAVRALRAGDSARPGDRDPLGFDLGPLAVDPGESGLRALTELGRGEEWLVEPQRLDDAGRLWSPGVRTGVAASSRFWEDAAGMPVIGVVSVHTLAEAIRVQNSAGSGAAAGLQSNDPDEVLEWLAGAEAAALSINRPTTEARIERQPGGGWNDAVMGIPALSGGPNRMLTLGTWVPREGTRSETLHLRGLDPEVQVLIEAAQASIEYEEFDQLRRAALADALAWRTSFGVERDEIGLQVERNVLRYHPVVTQIRLAEGGSVTALVRVLAAALLVRAPVAVSTGEVLPPEVSRVLEHLALEVSLERDEDWMERLAVSGPEGPEGVPAARLRLIDGDRVRAAEWMGGLDRAALWADPVTMAGPVELLTLLREQSVSARAHKHGLCVPVPGLDELLDGGGPAG
ncbi:aldehyde dehydrogenase family protein [Leucobacter zeae]|nr:aldehyde dehydrogenase family protein [Leucobacter zeae]